MHLKNLIILSNSFKFQFLIRFLDSDQSYLIFNFKYTLFFIWNHKKENMFYILQNDTRFRKTIQYQSREKSSYRDITAVHEDLCKKKHPFQEQETTIEFQDKFMLLRERKATFTTS